MVRAKVTTNFKSMPVQNALKFMNKTLIKPMPLAKTKLIYKQNAIYQNAHAGDMQQRIKKVDKLSKKFAFDTLENMRKNQRHSKYGL